MLKCDRTEHSRETVDVSTESARRGGCNGQVKEIRDEPVPEKTGENRLKIAIFGYFLV